MRKTSFHAQVEFEYSIPSDYSKDRNSPLHSYEIHIFISILNIENCSRKCLAVVRDIVIWYVHCRIRIHAFSTVLIHITSHWKFFF